MAHPAYVRKATTREIVLEHLQMAENCAKNPAALATYIDILYTIGPAAWVLVEIEVPSMVALMGVTHLTVDETQKIARYREKLLRGVPAPGALLYTDDGLRIISGQYTLLAMAAAKRERSRWYIPARDRELLNDDLLAIEEPEDDA